MKNLENLSDKELMEINGGGALGQSFVQLINAWKEVVNNFYTSLIGALDRVLK